ncbi:MAG: hypothetical protein ACRDY6_12260, partial [Acidimicrobiia bacterium]
MAVGAEPATYRLPEHEETPGEGHSATLRRVTGASFRHTLTARHIALAVVALALGAIVGAVLWHVRAGRRRRRSVPPITLVPDPRPRLWRAVLSAIDLRRRPPLVAARER